MSAKEPADNSKETPPKITVAGVTFGASDVVSAVVKIDGREITINRKEDEERKIGFYK
jgi:hypothetical protein